MQFWSYKTLTISNSCFWFAKNLLRNGIKCKWWHSTNDVCKILYKEFLFILIVVTNKEVMGNSCLRYYKVAWTQLTVHELLSGWFRLMWASCFWINLISNLIWNTEFSGPCNLKVINKPLKLGHYYHID